MSPSPPLASDSHLPASVLNCTTHSDYCLAVHDIRSYEKRSSSVFPAASEFLPILLWTPKPAEAERIKDLRNAIDILSAHSKSFSTASMVFDGRLRLDLLALYVRSGSLCARARLWITAQDELMHATTPQIRMVPSVR